MRAIPDFLRLSPRGRRLLLITLGTVLLLLLILTWRLFRTPEVAPFELLPGRPVAAIGISGLNHLIDDAKRSAFLAAIRQTPLVESFLRTRTWHTWVYRKQELEFQLQTRLDERTLRAVLGRRMAGALYPDGSFLLISVVSRGARLQILWSEWTDLFHSDYAIQNDSYRDVRLATLRSAGGVFYYTLIGRLGMLSPRRATLQEAIDRYRALPPRTPEEGITTYVDFTRYPAYWRGGDRLRATSWKEWRSTTRFEQGRWISEHQWTFEQPIEVVRDASILPPSIPEGTALAGFVRLSPQRLWEAVKAYVRVEPSSPSLTPYLRPAMSWTARATSGLLPAVAIHLPLRNQREFARELQKLHGHVFLNDKPIHVSQPENHGDHQWFPLRWSPVMLLRFQGGYTVTPGHAILANDRALLKASMAPNAQTDSPAMPLRAVETHDGAFWIQPDRFALLLKQASNLMALVARFSGRDPRWFSLLAQSTSPLAQLHEIRGSATAEGPRLQFQFEIVPQASSRSHAQGSR